MIIALPDTDVFVHVIHHSSCSMFIDLKELWVLSPNKASQKQAILFHKLVQELDREDVNVFPALHALAGTSRNFLISLLRYFQCNSRDCFRSRQSQVFWKVCVPAIYKKSLKDTCGGIPYVVKLKAKCVILYKIWNPWQVFIRGFA